MLKYIVLCVVLTGCGASWQQTGTTLSLGAAHATTMAGGLVQDQISIDCPPESLGPVDTHAAANSTPMTMCLHAHKLDIAMQAIAAAKDAVLTAMAAIHADAQSAWTAALPCLAATVTDILAALTDAGVRIPALLTEVMDMVRGFLGTCGLATAPQG